MTRSFNPRAREGRDSPRSVSAKSHERFNPRAREGRDQPLCLYFKEYNSFNPRAREGRDFAMASRTCCIIMFQSTRPRGARRIGMAWLQITFAVSIHAPARGATYVSGGFHWFWRCFNPRAREGRDRACTHRAILEQCFNPRAREGRDVYPR